MSLKLIHPLFLFGSLLITLLFLKALVISPLAKYFGDAPDHRKVHQGVVPRLGGLGMVFALLAVLALRECLPLELWPRSNNHLSAAMAFICVFLSGAGTMDDVRPLDYRLKFLFQFVLASGVVVVLGHHFGHVAILGHSINLQEFGPVISIFWLVAVMNAFNIIDGIDGLAAGAALCGFGAVAYLSFLNGSEYLLILSLTLMGILLGFLRFNFSKHQKMFLGDTGSQFLGAVMGLLAIQVQELPKNHASIMAPMLIVGYPLFDISVAMVRRFVKGGNRSIGRRIVGMFSADNEHLHHRLVYLGLSHVQSAFLLLLVAGTLGATSIILSRLSAPYRLGVLGYMGVALTLILNRLGYLGMRPWLTFPRAEITPEKIVGVIEPDEVFFHSLKCYKQNQYEFLSLPGRLTKFMGDDLIAVTVYNAVSGQFEESWTMALRASEFQDCPAIVIADGRDIEKVKAQNPEGYRSIHFMEKPVRVPDLIRELDKFSRIKAKGKPRATRQDRKLSLAVLAMRNHVRS